MIILMSETLSHESNGEVVVCVFESSADAVEVGTKAKIVVVVDGDVTDFLP